MPAENGPRGLAGSTAVVWGCTGTGRRVWTGAGGPKVAPSVPCRVGRASANRLKPLLGRARDQCG
eukprot:5456920-Prymnesium_polylepis.1